MKVVPLVTALLIVSASAASAQLYGTQQNFGTGSLYGTGSNSNSHTSDGYVRNNGTYVAPHSQTNPNNTQMDNYSTRGNYNPHTNTYGTRSPRY